jgi:hypothetical protein
MRALSILVLAPSGCARNGVLELELELPPQPPGAALFAVVQARSGDSFDEPWVDAEPPPSVALSPACARPAEPPSCGERILDPACSTVVSIVGDGDEIEAPLQVRVRFCESSTCETERVEHRIEIERAFYVGRYTQARVCLDEVPSDTNAVPESIERCEVRCRDGLTNMHCRLDGTHFCE